MDTATNEICIEALSKRMPDAANGLSKTGQQTFWKSGRQMQPHALHSCQTMLPSRSLVHSFCGDRLQIVFTNFTILSMTGMTKKGN